MSLDDEDRKLIELSVGATKGRLDFVEAVRVFHLAIASTVQLLDEDPELAGVRDRFASVLEDAVSGLEARLTDDERAQYRRLYSYFREVLDLLSPDS